MLNPKLNKLNSLLCMYKKKAISLLVLCFSAVIHAADYNFGDFVLHGPRDTKQFALTFDDGPGKSTREVLAVLKKHKAKATFFMLGDSVRYNKESALLVAKDGHLIANHTYAHKNFRPLGNAPHDDDVVEEIIKAQDIIYEATGKMPFLLRMPYGFMRAAAVNAAKDTGYILVNWTYGMDWNQQPRETVLKMYTDNLRGGSVFLFHDGGARKTETVVWLVDKILEEAKKRGLTAVGLDTLLGLDISETENKKQKLPFYLTRPLYPEPIVVKNGSSPQSSHGQAASIREEEDTLPE